jgi:hypothetical protein
MQLSKKNICLGHWTSWLLNGLVVAPACAAAFYFSDHTPDAVTPERLLTFLGALSVLNFLLLCLFDGAQNSLSRFSVPALLSSMAALMLALTAAALEKLLRNLIDLSWTVPFILAAIAINILGAFLEKRADLKILFCLQVNVLAVLAVFCWTDLLRLPL